jgi:hypothetical protein
VKRGELKVVIITVHALHFPGLLNDRITTIFPVKILFRSKHPIPQHTRNIKRQNEQQAALYRVHYQVKKGKGLPQQAEVAQGVPGRLRLQIFLTFGTTRVVGRQP